MKLLHRPFSKTVKRQLVLSVAMIHAVMMSLFVWDLSQRQKDFLLERQTEQAKSLVETMALSTTSGILSRDVAGIQEMVDNQKNFPDLVFAMLLDAKGQILAHSDHSRVGQFLVNMSNFPAEFAGPRPSILAQSKSLVDAVYPIMVNGRVIGWARIGLSQGNTADKLNAVTRDGLLYTAAAIFIGTLFALWLGKTLTSRLYTIRHVADLIRAGHHQSRVQLSGEDEIFALAQDFNGMLDALAQRDAEQARLHTHLRHETELAQNALRDLVQSEGKFRLILDSVAEGIFGTDENGNCIFVNRASLSALGYEEHEVLGKPIHALIHHHHADGSLYSEEDCPSHHTFQSGHGCHVNDEVYWHKDGSAVPVEYWTRPVIEADRTSGVVVAWIDVTQQRQAEERLRKLSRAVDQSTNGIMITDAHGRIEYANRSLERHTGYALADLQGQNPRILKSDQTAPEIFDAMWQHIRRGESWQGEVVNRRRNGDLYTAYLIVSPIRQPNGEISHYLTTEEDITEKKRNAEELTQYRNHLEAKVAKRTQEIEALNRQLAERAQDAESANMAKSSFLANMSHEIRTPLNAITGMVHILRRDPLTSQQRNCLEKIDSAGSHLLSVINDILDLSKIEAGKLALEHLPIDVGDIVREVADLVTERIHAKQLELHIECPSYPPRFLGDPTRIRQALLNYVGNAIKFTLHGHITIRLHIEEEDEAGALLRLSVSDTGIGVSPEMQHRLFDKFVQADNSTTRQFGGTGLGLNITRRLAELMDGSVGLSSEPGRGSCFWFTFRLEKYHGAETLPHYDNTSGVDLSLLQGRPTLLVEDDEINREIALLFLHEYGMLPDVAENGREAVARCAEHDYDLILMDMQMPEMDGLEATLHIRRLPKHQHTPIVATTANAFVEDKASCFAAGMSDFLSKPIDPELLKTTLVKWLGRPDR